MPERAEEEPGNESKQVGISRSRPVLSVVSEHAYEESVPDLHSLSRREKEEEVKIESPSQLARDVEKMRRIRILE